MKRESEISVIAEISILNEILLLQFSDLKKDFAEVIIEKATRLFGVRRLAILLGEGVTQKLVASLAFRNKKEILDKIDQSKPNYFKFDFVKNGKFGTLFMEQAHPIGARERRLYSIFARQLENALIVAEEAAGRKQAEEALQESEEKLDAMLQSIGDNMSLIDKDFNIIWANEATKKVFGDDVIGKKCYEAYHGRKEPCEPHPCLTFKAFQDGKVHNYDSQVLNKDGEIAYFHVTANVALRNKEGEPTAVLEVSKNVTERKRAEKARQASEENFHRSLEDSPLGVRIFDAEGETLYANRAILDIYGYASIEELKTTPVEKRLTPESYTEHLIRRERRLRGEGISKQFEMSIVRKDGEIRHLQVFRKEVMWNGARQIQSIYQDITERKRAEEALRESEELWVAMANSSQIGVFIVQDERYVFVNQRFQEGSGYTEAELLSMDRFKLIPPDEGARVREKIRSMLKGELRAPFESRAIIKNGETRWIMETATPIQYKGKGATLGCYMDITERKRMERELQERNEQLDAQNEELQSQAEELITQQQELIEKTKEVERANQLKSEFLAGMSHELRTPLNVVIGFSELMLDGVPGEVNDEQRECLGDILAGGQHLLNLINDILDLSKVEAGKMEFKLESLNLADVINDAAQTIKLLLDDKGHKLRVSVEEGLPQVRADRGRLKQVFLNLLSNATKFTPPGGKLGIEVSRQGDWCQTSVVDNGMGIKEEDQEKIFEVFTQAEALPDGNKRGTGLGLALTRQFVEVMGGRIWVESEYGKGSRFTFTLPLAGEDEPYLEEKREELEVGLSEVKEPPTKPGQKLVLLVDDDHRTRRLVSAWLKAEGCAIAEASTGDEGIKKAKELAPALIILDILMPDKDGWQVLQALKSMPETRDIPVVITSVIEEKELGFRLGAVDYFVKPVDRKRFQKRIAELGITRREKVLIVDDNPADVRLVASILEAENIKTLCAYSGEEGVRMAKENEPSLIVLDILMPDLDGFEVIERLRQDEKTRNIPIIILTMKELAKEELRMLWQTKAIIMKATFSREDFVSEVKRVVSLGGE